MGLGPGPGPFLVTCRIFLKMPVLWKNTHWTLTGHSLDTHWTLTGHSLYAHWTLTGTKHEKMGSQTGSGKRVLS